MRLPSTQVAVLEAASATEDRTIERLAEELGEKPETVTGVVFGLEEEGLLDVSEEELVDVSLTEEGEEYVEMGLPERRLYEAALDLDADEEPAPMGEVIDRSGLEGEEVDIALSNYARKGYGEIDSGELLASDHEEDEEADALALIDAGEPVPNAVLDDLVRRDLVSRRESTVRSVTLTDEGVTALMEGVEESETVGQITPELLTTGEWEEVEFAEYNVEADAAEVTGGKKHVLRQTADRVKDVLVGMGFEEMDGPHADADFWINDALFMPQDHPARTHWDRFTLERPERMDGLPEDLLERVRSAHLEGVGTDGEGYHSPWSEEMAREIALRGHTTSLSMRYLSGEAIGELEPPQRYFSVEKVYRNDTLDPTHLLEFFQIEGWVMAEDLSVRDLKGTFTEFYERFGITDLQFKPHYNPYTEPSFELFGHHPETGELIEIGNSGMFRPEVLEPLGVDCDVMAWGLALERLAMLITGAEDIRDLHGTLADIEFLREAEVIY
ncbi:phenylalanine--tRNA ligase subunit alpha [Halalkalicoccus subterraneus]|uniref:phenylalanine--tRNA ligase subunit alpha n=1 Tax=Halalkalicoccus subterraneus TaxID=2675002 RepID=UPI000EFC3BDA|nr:phenylalanine--tRNA ligase subunit alpha [Halalkalicoccus subterraneus]